MKKGTDRYKCDIKKCSIEGQDLSWARCEKINADGSNGDVYSYFSQDSLNGNLSAKNFISRANLKSLFKLPVDDTGTDPCSESWFHKHLYIIIFIAVILTMCIILSIFMVRKKKNSRRQTISF